MRMFPVQCRIWLRRVWSCRAGGDRKIPAGCFFYYPAEIHEHHPVATLLAKPFHEETTIMVIPSSARAIMTVQNLLHHLRVQERSRLVKEHDLRLHTEAAGYGDPLLLAAGKSLVPDISWPARRYGPFQIVHCRFFRLFFGSLSHQIGPSDDFQ